MKRSYLILTFLSLFICGFAQKQTVPVPKPHQLKWHEAEMGAVFHYDRMYSTASVTDQGNNRINPIEDYNIFNPARLDTDQWIQAAKAAGCQIRRNNSHSRNRFRTLAERRQPLLPESGEMAERQRGYRTRLCQLLPQIRVTTGNLCRHPVEFPAGHPQFQSGRRKASSPVTVRHGTNGFAKRWLRNFAPGTATST